MNYWFNADVLKFEAKNTMLNGTSQSMTGVAGKTVHPACCSNEKEFFANSLCTLGRPLAYTLSADTKPATGAFLGTSETAGVYICRKFASHWLAPLRTTVRP